MSNPVVSGERAVPGFSDPVTMAEHLARYKFALAFVAGREVENSFFPFNNYPE
ncbi:hypothetical protein [Desulfofundulus thermosubterraneus]|uniref:Uncharacterized protein n=1 Tax=Desulfofundulus thermosubterraneus DSM 16057 TaxID=1121432 RepID=A0A1M6D6I7_9FIRM|nr:hypothetical protein [Desulfofundulus thermosubterraneus]SHI68842.1 hypothetical protein SAMN02745219_00842 [Desulfofundulus thermosubterraneus DSM 16057]